ncbi:hypothetical protein PROFUN_10387 [Planoprotostelium fungivorum]|uniref:Uncharacterized protein n=1 Tax=Planoprotostelium fungivorum TaxID=1890364 RepID=A0A2P6NEF9_9EUKA|nr:hypothetical protein PROFUN_10387 [Planoprotostelium fungivorum]
MDIKASLEEQLRRTTLPVDAQNYKNLLGRLSALFNRPNLETTHSLKYMDDEGDWVDVSSDEELQIALSLARQMCTSLRLSLHGKKAAVEEKPREEPKPVDPFQEIQSHFQRVAEQWRPLIERVAEVAMENGFNPETVIDQLASISIEREEPLPVHSAWCDHCNARIAGTRYKCLQCPDFDLCQRCLNTNRDLHDAEHDFLHILRPGSCTRQEEEKPEESEEPKSEEPKEEEEKTEEVAPSLPSDADLPIHWAICDHCQQRIRGIRHKCSDCRDYDLCNACVPNRDSVHPGHSFHTIDRPACPFARQEVPQPAAVPEAVPAVPEVVEAVPVIPVEEVAPEPANALPAGLTAEKLQAGLKQLEEMGFCDRESNIKAIIKNGGDIVTTIVDLLE